MLAGTAAAQAAPDAGSWQAGLSVWLLSAVWAAGVIRGYLQPQSAGYLAAGLGLLTGAQLTMDEAAGHVLAIATVAALLTAGVLLGRVVVVGLGAAGVLVLVPQTATRYLPSAASAPLSVLAVALAVLGFALWLAKRWRPHSR